MKVEIQSRVREKIVQDQVFVAINIALASDTFEQFEKLMNEYFKTILSNEAIIWGVGGSHAWVKSAYDSPHSARRILFITDEN